jgi:hypothetical protein
MTGQLCWIPKFGGGGKLGLHLRLESHHHWKPYTAFPGLCIPDYPIPGGSKGWATSQKLIQAGWVMIPTKQAQTNFDAPVSNLINLSTFQSSGSGIDPQFG